MNERQLAKGQPFRFRPAVKEKKLNERNVTEKQKQNANPDRMEEAIRTDGERT